MDGTCICRKGYSGEKCEILPQTACDTISCPPGYICSDGTCVCPNGFEGTGCNILSREKFIANWHVLEDGTLTLSSQYPTTIVAAVDTQLKSDVIIYNFHNSSNVTKGFIKKDTLFIPSQKVGGEVVVGKGVYTMACQCLTVRYRTVDTMTNEINDYGYDTVAYPGSKVSSWDR